MKKIEQFNVVFNYNSLLTMINKFGYIMKYMSYIEILKVLKITDHVLNENFRILFSPFKMVKSNFILFKFLSTFHGNICALHK